MIVGRKQSLDRAVELVQAGISVEIVGGRGSGRTAFLNALRSRLDESGWTVVSVRGIASLRQHPLAALHLAGIGGGTRPAGGLHETAEALRKTLLHARSALFLDDWDDLDESSWGVAVSVGLTAGVALVVSRLDGPRARNATGGRPGSSLESPYFIDMSPLRFEDMEKALSAYLKAPIESTTMSRIYAKSGGNIGLAVSMIDSATREGQLVRRAGGEWVASRDLWSPALRTVVEGYLENLDAAARDALEIIALVGLASVDTIRKLVEWETLELLEERSMVAFVESGQSQLITVVPPLLVEFFRHEALSARRMRLTQLIIERLGTDDPVTAVLGEPDRRHAVGAEGEALFVRLLHERARAMRLVTATEWEAARTPENAVRYIMALRQTFTPGVRETVRRVLAETDADAGDASDRAQLAALRARWSAYVDHEVDAAVRDLRDAREGLDAHVGLLDAAEVEIEVNLRGVPEGFSDRLEVSDEMPDAVKIELLQTQLLILVSAARFSDAQRVYADLERIGPPSTTARVLQAIAFLGMAEQPSALEIVNRGFGEAHSNLDIEGVRSFGAAALLCHVYSGNIHELDELIDSVSAAGEPTPFPAGYQLALLSVGALTAIRRGQVATGERLVAEVDQLGVPDGPLPGQSSAWGHAQLLLFNGRTSEAADLFWESSERLWERQAHFGALMGLLGAVEIEPTESRLAAIRAHLRSIEEPTILHTQAAFFEAVFADDVEGIEQAGQEFERTHRVGLALSAYLQLTALAERLQDTASVERAAQRIESIRRRHGAVAFDVGRFSSSAVLLTEREREVAALASGGYSNQEIATRLVLSVRTVESHMHRIMRKLGVSSRHAIDVSSPGVA
ncbi:helix-turn-helix transcriptional regulator [Microbacterium sp. MYb66]|uniref:helix-turn-helix transcriptional regulator n=1 Tax=Microbacterium sp. MYb66 TaxID=1848692 RepID=UPI000CFEE94B|nr:helix-turn-helix transcriptional regulator [Microbacterium sp. MYb66]PRA82189.1 hypothetical protein CQ045_05750 [Microbacterium sp. MYb66]